MINQVGGLRINWDCLFVCLALVIQESITHCTNYKFW